MYKEPEDLGQRKINLQTEAEDEDVSKVIFKIKSSEDFGKNVTNLARQGKEMVTIKQLRSCLAFLHNTTVEDRKVAILHKSGLCKMIMVRIYQLAPHFCALCQKFHYLMRGQEPVISCLRCGTGACPTCYTREENPTLKKWKFICEGCESVVENDLGLGKLEAKDWDKDYDKKKNKTNVSQDVPKKTPEKAPEEEEADEEDAEKETVDLEIDENLAAAAAKVQGKKSEQDQQKSKNDDEKEKRKNTVCPHLKKGRCYFGLTGRREYEGKSECPFKHPRTCDALLNHGVKGNQGCREKTSGCRKFHPKFCHYSLNKGVCFDKDCKLGFHVKGTNTKAARAKAEEEKQKRGSTSASGGSVFNGLAPGLPAPQQPEALQSVLGQQSRASVAHPSPFQAALQQHHQKQLPVQQQPQIQQQQPTDQAATFLGQILMQGILQMLQPKRQEKDQEKQQEKRVAPGLNMEQLLRLLSLPQ